MVLWQIVGVGHGARSRNSSSPTLDITQGVQQTLDAVVERLLLLHRVVEHLGKADAGGVERVFKNARFLNTCNRRTLARAGGLIPMIFMTTLPVTYGYARVSKSDDEAGNLETQLRLLADHGIRQDLIFSDIASGRTLRRAGWQELMARLRPGDTLAVAFLDRLSRNFEEGVQEPGGTHRAGTLASWPSGRTSTPATVVPRPSFFAVPCWLRGLTRWTRPASASSWDWTRPGPAGSGWDVRPALTPEQVAQCRRMTEEGAGLRHIARVMQCSPATVRKAPGRRPGTAE